MFNVRDTASQMGAASIDKVFYRDTYNHPCYTGGNKMQYRIAHLQKASDGTFYGMCPHCHRFFYSTPTKYNKRFDGATKQFQVSYAH